MNDNTIVELLNAEIEKTLTEVSQARTGSDEARAALTKLGRLHEQRIKELDAELKNNQRIDSDLAKRDELKIREHEVDQKLSLMEKEMALKLAQLENEKLKAQFVEIASAETAYAASAIAEMLGVSTQKASALMRALKADGVVAEGEGKSATGKGKVKTYTLTGVEFVPRTNPEKTEG